MTRALRFICGTALGCALFSGTAGADLAIGWYTIDAGGGVSSGATFDLVGTIGQPDAGVMSGGGFELRGGFWPAVAATGVTPCDGDTDGDRDVDVDDLLNVLGAFGDPGPGSPGDADGDGDSDIDDLLVLLRQFGVPCP